MITIKSKINLSIQLIVALIGFIVVYSVLVVTTLPPNYDYQVGDLAKENIIAPHRIVDEKLTEKKRDEASAGIEEVYRYIPGTSIEAKENAAWLFGRIIELSTISDEIITEINNKMDTEISKEIMDTLLAIDISQRANLKESMITVIDKLYYSDVSMQNLESKKNEARALFDSMDFSPVAKDAAFEITAQLIKPNMILDVESTRKAVEDARSRIPLIAYDAGDIVVSKDEILTSDTINLLIENKMMRDTYLNDPYLILGVLVLLSCIVGIYYMYLRAFYNKLVIKDQKRTMILVILFSLMILIAIPVSGFSAYMIPVSLLTMTIALLTEKRLAITSTIFYVMILAFSIDLSVIHIILFLMNGYIAAIGMMKISKRGDIMKTGLLTAVFNVLLIGSYNLIIHNFALSGIKDMMYGFSNGIISAVLTIGTLVIWEWAFDISTPIMLVELANPNNPLLKKLMTNAPGTYHHSIIVGNLAESAAENIGANALLVRVGAYYHDVGKSLAPVYFTENQVGEVNPHDYISPQKSVQIIKNHVTKGYEMAKEHKIPSEVRNFILTHHGASTIEYFYHKATEGNGNVDKNDFKYEAINPETKEEGILTLADSVEAAVRSIRDITKEKIAERVEKIFEKKIAEGVLDNCELSLKDLGIIKGTFIKILNSVYHERVEYPDIDKSKG
ncbi:MAG: HDIG domain-containing protein [Eubacteriaceae bacterium]|nr:HDIG domain-containing protein [Eubacteriaceae bacterium]